MKFLATALLVALSATSPDPSQPAPALPLGPEAPHVVQGGALDSDCSHVAAGLGGKGYQFIVTCAGKAVSPDGRYAVTTKGGEPEEGDIPKLRDSRGRDLDELRALADAMPFVLFWSPRSDWFFVNHYQGSGQDRLRLFQVVNRVAVERSDVFAEATRIMVERHPCLGRTAMVMASGWRWSRDGRRVALVAYSRPDACQVERGRGNWVADGNWDVLWMIGDVANGRIDPASIRIRRDGVGPMPKDGPYATL